MTSFHPRILVLLLLAGLPATGQNAPAAAAGTAAYVDGIDALAASA